MEKGFTLIEVIVSMALVAILILAVSSMNLLSVRINNVSRGRDGAFNLARGLCEAYNVRDISDSWYNSGAVYKYIDSLEEVEYPEEVFTSRDGDYRGQDIVDGARSEGYLVVLEPVRVFPPALSSYPVPEVKSLSVTVRENRPHGAIVTLTRIR